MENSASLTGCNRLTCKGDGKLFLQEDQVNPTISDDEGGIFLNQRNFPTIFWSQAKEFSDNFPSAFRQWIKFKSSTTWARTTSFRVAIFYSTTAPHSLCIFDEHFQYYILRHYTVYLRQYCIFHCQQCVYTFVSTLFTFVSTVFFSSVLCSPPSILCFSSSVLC
jgi:hypothetical protein